MLFQVDVHFLRLMLPTLVVKTETLDKMLDEIIISAGERCVDPSPMEQSIVTSIGQQKKQKMQQRSS